MNWKDGVKIEIVDRALGRYHMGWEEIYQAFKERIITDRLEKEEDIEPGCKHGADWPPANGHQYPGNYCRDCGEKL